MGFNPVPVKDFIGKGLIFPFVLNNGSGQLDSGFALIRASISTILSYSIGGRYFLREFGSRLEELLEEPNDSILQGVINTFVVDAVLEWEKRVSTISATIVRPNPTSIDLDITYQVVNVSNPDNFVYPFYRQIIY